MLNDYERRTLHEVEREIRSTDPALAAFLHDGQRRLPRTLSHLGYDATMVLLTLLFVLLLLLRLPASALVVAALAGGLWWLRGQREQREQRNAGEDSR